MVPSLSKKIVRHLKTKIRRLKTKPLVKNLEKKLQFGALDPDSGEHHPRGSNGPLGGS